MKISVMLPSYNEEENLKIILPQLNHILTALKEEYELLVIDAKNSSDNSETVCKDNNAKFIKQQHIGYGDAFRKGIEVCNGELFLVVDSDNSQDIEKIPEMYKEMLNGADVVIGSRYTSGGTTADPLISVFMSKLLNTAYRLVLGFKEKDISTDFRFYKTYMLQNIHIKCNNFDIIEETLFTLKKQYPEIIIKEIPINYKKRTVGNSKRKLFTFIFDYIRLLFKLSKIKKGR